jgi:hypothetical protein
LAIGAAAEDLGSPVIVNAGAVNVIYGSASGLSATATPDQVWHQASANIEGAIEQHDMFGHAVAAGDFNGDGYSDLAIGVPGEGIGTSYVAGAVNVIYGSASGLSATATPDQVWHQDSPNVEDVSEDTDSFGSALAS